MCAPNPSLVSRSVTLKFANPLARGWGPALKAIIQCLFFKYECKDPGPSWPTKWARKLPGLCRQKGGWYGNGNETSSAWKDMTVWTATSVCTVRIHQTKRLAI